MWRKHFIFWVAGLFALLLMTPIYSSPESMWGNAKHEISLIEGAFGKAESLSIVARTTKIYNSLFIETGIVKPMSKMYVTNEEIDRGGLPGPVLRVLSSIGNGYLITFSAMIYVIIMRALIFASWLPYILPFSIAVMVDGVAHKTIKRETFGHTNSNTFALAMHIGLICLFLPIAYLFVPYPFTPLFVPVWALVSAFPMSVAIANSQPLLPVGS